MENGWEVGVASRSNLWVWLECIGVVSGCCKEVYRYCNGSSEARTSFDGWQQILQENIMGKT